MIPRLTLLWLLLLLIARAAQASTLKGVVLANQEGGSAVAKVKVSADGANLTETGESGRFTLQFPNKQPGETVQLEISKLGYVVVNWFQLKVTLPKNVDAEPLTLLICKEAERERWALLFYRIKGQDAVEETYQRRLKELEEKNQQSAAAIAKLQQERDQAKAEAEKTAEGFARLKPGETTDLYAQAMALFLKGKVDEALQVLDEKKLHLSLVDARQKKEEAEKAEEKAVQGYLLRAQLLTTQLRFNEANRVYQIALEAVPGSFDASFAYGYFNQSLNRFEESRVAYTHAVEIATQNENQEELALSLNDLGVIDEKQNRLDQAREHLQEALRVRRTLAEQNPSKYDVYAAQTLENLGVSDFQEDRLNEARKHFEEALEIFLRTNTGSPEIDILHLANTFNSLGILDEKQGRLALARRHYETSLLMCRALALQTSDAYQSSRAMTLTNLAGLDRTQNRAEEALSELREATVIYRELSERNSEMYRPSLAMTLANFGFFELQQMHLNDAREHLEEALQIYNALLKQNSEAYLPNQASVLNTLAGVDKYQNRAEDARWHLTQSVSTYRELAKHNQLAYRGSLAGTLSNLGTLDEGQGCPAEARRNYQEALDIFVDLERQNPDLYAKEVVRVRSLLNQLPVKSSTSKTH